MQREKEDILKEIFSHRTPVKHFETETNIYWVLFTEYIYDYKKVSEEKFEEIKQYVLKNKTTPAAEYKRKKYPNKHLEELKSSSNYDFYSNLGKEYEYIKSTKKEEVILRYSKNYDSLDLYTVSQEIRCPMARKDKKMLVLTKTDRHFLINKNNFTRFNSPSKTQWLSLKNVNRFNSNFYGLIGPEAIKLLIFNTIKKGWVKNLDINKPYYLSNKIARNSNSFDEAVFNACGTKPSKNIIKFFEGDINNVIGLYSLLDSSQIHYLTNFAKNNLEKIHSLTSGNYKFFLFYYFLVKDNRLEYRLFNDYLNMLIQSGEKINLKISSSSTISKKHDELSKKILFNLNKKDCKLGVKRIFPEIKSFQNFEVEKIKSLSRLNYESEIQHHCVHSYSEKIKRGSCAIYSIIFEDNRYTLEINKRKNGNKDFELYLAQLKGKFNSSAPNNIEPYLKKICEKYNIKFENLYFQNKKNSYKVIQIGAEILERCQGVDWVNRKCEYLEDKEIEKEIECDLMPF